MRIIALCLSLLIAFQMTCYPVPVLADVSYSGGAVSGNAPVNKIGNLLLAEGLAVLSSTTIEVQAKSKSGQQQTQLQGTLFKVSQLDSGAVTGSCYFNSGPGLSTLDSANCEESVRLTDGSKVIGAISSLTQDAITCAGRSIPMSQVKSVNSARVFNFRANVGESPRMSFESCCVKPVAAKQQKTKSKASTGEHSKAVRVLTVCLLLAGLACAITLPIVIPLASGGGGHRNPPINPLLFAPRSPTPVGSGP